MRGKRWKSGEKGGSFFLISYFVFQSLFNSLPKNELKGSSIVLGGDGR